MTAPRPLPRQTAKGTALDTPVLELDLLVNGKPERLAAATVADLLGALDLDASRKGIAVAVNGAVVPRRGWDTAPLSAGDAVEIIHAKQGG